MAPLVLRAMRARGVRPAAVVVSVRGALAECFHAVEPRARVRELPLVPLRALWRRLRPRLRRELRVGAPLVVTGSLDSPRMRRDVARLEPDLLVLAGCGLLRPESLALARLGTINGHPGLLPWVRGNGVVGNALLRGVAVGATVHLVDAGIDTGPIVRRRLVRPGGGERTLREVETLADAVAADLLADVAWETSATGSVPPAIEQAERAPLCRWLSVAERGQADALVAAGRAVELYDAWSARHPESAR